jgi:hypothetical protein
MYRYLKQKRLFSKMKDRKAKQVLSGGLVPVWGGNGGNLKHSCMKMENETC